MQYFYNIARKKWVMKLFFLHADNKKSSLQIESIFSDGFGQACPKSQAICNIFEISQERN